jgi:signal transduction histidine kinase
MKSKSVQSCNLCKSVIQTFYDIVKAHGGAIKVISREGKGSNFLLTLPRLE